MIKFYDTNALLALKETAFEDFFACSHKTLEEIENIKTSGRKDEEVKYRARKLARLFDTNSNYKVCNFDYSQIVELIGSKGVELSPDSIIAAEAYLYSKDNEIEFVTDDINCKNIAKNIFELNVSSVSNLTGNIYKGYIQIEGTTDEINEQMLNLDYSQIYVNEYCIIHNLDEDKWTEMRYNGEVFEMLRLPPSKEIKGKNSLQRCALDALMNKDIGIVAILGGYGSGKTFLAMQMAKYHVCEKGNQSKILGVREPKGEGAEVGFLKGTFEDKTEQFFKPLEQQLQGGMFEMGSMRQRGVVEANIPYYMKGTTYNDTIIFVDEAEDLTEAQIRLVGTRLGENSRIYFAGDYEQSLFNKTSTNPLIKMCEEFKGNPNFACVALDEDVRSSTSKMFANLFKR